MEEKGMKRHRILKMKEVIRKMNINGVPLPAKPSPTGIELGIVLLSLYSSFNILYANLTVR